MHLHFQIKDFHFEILALILTINACEHCTQSKYLWFSFIELLNKGYESNVYWQVSIKTESPWNTYFEYVKVIIKEKVTNEVLYFTPVDYLDCLCSKLYTKITFKFHTHGCRWYDAFALIYIKTFYLYGMILLT